MMLLLAVVVAVVVVVFIKHSPGINDKKVRVDGQKRSE